MEKITLKAQLRDIPTKKINRQRKTGLIPAVLYGKNQTNQHLFVEDAAFKKVYGKAGESSLIDLIVGDQPSLKVLIYEVSKDAVTDKVDHIDFYQIDMTKTFTFTIPLLFVGESKAVKELEGTLVKNLDEVEISCLPSDLIHEIEVDISPLKTFEDVIRVKDLKVPTAITVKTDENEAIASVVPPYVEEVPAVTEEVKEAETEAGKETTEAAEETKAGEAAKTSASKKEK